MNGHRLMEVNRGRPSADLPERVTLSVLRTAEALVAPLTEVIRAVGLTQSQYNVLRILRGVDAGLPCGEISEKMVRRDPDLTRLLDRLEARGLVLRQRDLRDRRVVRAFLTSTGREIVDTLDDPVRESHHRALGHMSTERLFLLLELLEEARRGEAAPRC